MKLGSPAISCKTTWLAAGWIVTFTIGALPSSAHGCKIEQLAEFHITQVANSPIIEGQINGHPMRVLLETGSVMSYITDPAAHELGLPIRQYNNHILYSVRGNDQALTADVKELRIGSVVVKDSTVNVVGSGIQDANGVASYQLGVDFLSHFTTEFDFAHGIVRLLHPQDCKPEQLAYWSPNYFQLDLKPLTPPNLQYRFSVTVNGKPMQARLVSGSAFSSIVLQAAKEAGVEPNSPGAESAEPVVGLTETPIPMWIGRFDTIQLGNETIKNARLRMGDLVANGKRDVTGSHVLALYRDPTEVKLGSDFLQSHRMIIEPELHVALFTYNGGAVFQAEQPDAAAPSVSNSSTPAR
jgi:gag-polyprotein putative aspartyl protease